MPAELYSCYHQDLSAFIHAKRKLETRIRIKKYYSKCTIRSHLRSMRKKRRITYFCQRFEVCIPKKSIRPPNPPFRGMKARASHAAKRRAYLGELHDYQIESHCVPFWTCSIHYSIDRRDNPICGKFRDLHLWTRLNASLDRLEIDGKCAPLI